MNFPNPDPGFVEKKLIYILNKIDEADTSHFYHVLNLLKTLQGLGWEIRLLSEKGGEGVREIGGMEICYLSRANPVERFFRLCHALMRARREGFRLTFVRISVPAALVTTTFGRLLGFKTIFWNSSANHDLKKGVSRRRRALDRVAFRLIVALLDRFVTGPESMVDYYVRHYGVPRRKLSLLYNDVDLSRFAPMSRRRRAGGPIRILSVHRFSPAKQTPFYLPDLIETLNGIATAERPVVLELVGDGPERADVKKAVEVAGPHLRVELPGAIPNARITDHYRKADIFIMPSRREGMPRVLIEAMAMGLPFVTTDAGGSADLIDPRHMGFVVSRDDPKAFANAVAILIGRRELWPILSAENLARAQRYSTPAVAKMYDDLLVSRLRA